MATVYSDRGYGVRAPVVFYNRSNEAAAQLKPGDFDWAAIFRAGVRWFHSGGIFAALSETTGELILEAMQVARQHGAVVSFDLNYREKLWRASGGHSRALSVLQRIVENVDVLVGNEEDLQQGLGIAGPEVAAKSKLDPAAFVAMIERVVERYPSMKVVATTLRDVHSSNRHSWGAVAWIDGQAYVAPVCQLDVLRPRRWRRQLCRRSLLRTAHGRDARGIREARLGSRRAGDDVPGRYDYGNARAGARLCQGRVRADSAVERVGCRAGLQAPPPRGLKTPRHANRRESRGRLGRGANPSRHYGRLLCAQCRDRVHRRGAARRNVARQEC